MTLDDNRTCFDIACRNNNRDMIKLLSEFGAKTYANNTSWFTCCEMGFVEIVQIIAQSGFDTNCKQDQTGYTGLHLACKYGHFDIVKLLVDKNVVVTRDNNGMTPVLLAALYGFEDIVILLLGKTDYARGEFVEAYELLYAWYLDNEVDKRMYYVSKHWIKAELEREKQPQVVKPKTRPEVLFDYVVEVDELEHLMKCINTNKFDVKMYAMVVRTRILGKYNLELRNLYEHHAMYYAGIGHYHKALDFVMHVFECEDISGHRERFNHRRYIMCVQVLSKIALHEQSMPETKVAKLVKLFGLIKRDLIELPDKFNGTLDLHNTLVTLLYVIDLLSENVITRHTFKADIAEIIALDKRGIDGKTLLHIACSRYKHVSSNDIPSLPPLPIASLVMFLVDCGAKVDDVDDNGNNAFHLIAQSKQLHDCSELYFKLLLRKQVLLTKNRQQLTPVDILYREADDDIENISLGSGSDNDDVRTTRDPVRGNSQQFAKWNALHLAR